MGRRFIVRYGVGFVIMAHAVFGGHLKVGDGLGKASGGLGWCLWSFQRERREGKRLLWTPIASGNGQCGIFLCAGTGLQVALIQLGEGLGVAEKWGVDGVVDDVQLAVGQVAMQVLSHGRRGECVFAAVNQQDGAVDVWQQGAGIV